MGEPILLHMPNGIASGLLAVVGTGDEQRLITQRDSRVVSWSVEGARGAFIDLPSPEQLERLVGRGLTTDMLTQPEMTVVVDAPDPNGGTRSTGWTAYPKPTAVAGGGGAGSPNGPQRVSGDLQPSLMPQRASLGDCGASEPVAQTLRFQITPSDAITALANPILAEKIAEVDAALASFSPVNSAPTHAEVLDDTAKTAAASARRELFTGWADAFLRDLGRLGALPKVELGASDLFMLDNLLCEAGYHLPKGPK